MLTLAPREARCNSFRLCGEMILRFCEYRHFARSLGTGLRIRYTPKLEMAEAFQQKRKIDNLGLFHRELLAEFDRRGFVTYSGREQFHHLVKVVSRRAG